MTEAWNESLFGCLNDPLLCLKGWLCPCIVFGENVEKLEGSGCMGSCLMYACCPLCTVCCIRPGKRTAFRAKYNLVEEPCGDCLVSVCCNACSLCQEARELNVRGAPQQQQMA